jgi:hypothetical protein
MPRLVYAKARSRQGSLALARTGACRSMLHVIPQLVCPEILIEVGIAATNG